MRQQPSRRHWLGVGLIALLVGMIVMVASQATVSQAAGTQPELTVEKRVLAEPTNGNGGVVPLAGARYRVTRILPVRPGQIVATKPETYTVATGAQAFQATLVTGANGRGQLTAADGLALWGYYLVSELQGPGVKQPAAPVAIEFTTARLQITITPKSGLVPTKVPRLPETMTAAGQPMGRKIYQTGGNFATQVPILVLVGVLALASMAVAGGVIAGRHRLG